jgi:hypothetical protein
MRIGTSEGGERGKAKREEEVHVPCISANY